MDEIFRMTVDSPLGRVQLLSTREALVEVRLPAKGPSPTAPSGEGKPPPVLVRAAGELARYFRGDLTAFTVPLASGGTEFQRAVWETLAAIPFGEVRSYGWVAARIGRAAACRAVGSANGRNPLPIFVPCHRVIGADGSLSGYGGGVAAKRWLLEHERRVLALLPRP